MHMAKTSIAAILIFSVTPTLYAKKHTLEHAPLPVQVISAKTLYIDNESAYPSIADKAYTLLKKWGRYQIVDSKEGADLVLQFTVARSQTQTPDRQWVSMYNTNTQSYTYGSVPAGTSTRTWFWTRLRVISPTTKDVLWADQAIWNKHSATVQILDAFVSRVDEQTEADTR